MHGGFMIMIIACLIIVFGIGEAHRSNGDWWD
jgi:hypothetical protein